jgi:hypothetical protein
MLQPSPLQVVSDTARAATLLQTPRLELIAHLGEPDRQRRFFIEPRITLLDALREDPDVLMDGEFMLNEFIDRYGPRLAHLNGVLQVLAQLGNTPAPTTTAN